MTVSQAQVECETGPLADVVKEVIEQAEVIEKFINRGDRQLSLQMAMQLLPFRAMTTRTNT